MSLSVHISSRDEDEHKVLFDRLAPEEPRQNLAQVYRQRTLPHL